MKLLHDCVRDVMLDVEDNLKDGDSISSDDIYNRLNKYAQEDVDYTCKKLSEANYLNIIPCITGEILVTGISYSGHQFLDTIRDSNIWRETKSTVSKLASVSLPIIQQVASQLINHKLGI